MSPSDRDEALRMRGLLAKGEHAPETFRFALTRVPALDRDAWVDLAFGLEEPPLDDPGLPRGCVPYLPCPVDAVLRTVDEAAIAPDDAFVDIGSGLGRTLALVRLITGASCVGVEIQPALVAASRDLARTLELSRISVIDGDAAELVESITIGSVFFLYCPFSDARLVRVLDGIGRIAESRQIRVAAVDLPLPARPWLTPLSPPAGDLAVYGSPAIRPSAWSHGPGAPAVHQG